MLTSARSTRGLASLRYRLTHRIVPPVAPDDYEVIARPRSDLRWYGRMASGASALSCMLMRDYEPRRDTAQHGGSELFPAGVPGLFRPLPQLYVPEPRWTMAPRQHIDSLFSALAPLMSREIEAELSTMCVYAAASPPAPLTPCLQLRGDV